MENSTLQSGRKSRALDHAIEPGQSAFKIWYLLVIAGAVILTAGLSSVPYLGDEIHHYRFAKESFLTGHRAIYDSLYGTPFAPGYIFATEVFWPLVLSWIWRAIGFISFPVAQIYHTGFYVSLVAATYLLGKELYDQKTGFVAAVLVGSVPMVASFGILFYIDVPAASFVAVTLLAFVKRKYVWMGIAFGLAYLSKRHNVFLMPAFMLLLLFFPQERAFKRVVHAVVFLGACFLTVIPEVIWHRIHVTPVLKARPSVTFSFSTAITEHLNAWSQTLKSGSLVDFFKTREFLNSSLLDGIDLIKYFGPFILIGMALYCFRRRFERRDLVLLVIIGNFMAAFVVILRLGSDIRYMLPIISFLAILAARGGTAILKNRKTTALTCGLCLLQLVTVAAYVQQVRQPTQEIQKGFQFIRENLPEDALILYPEANLMDMTERKVIWGLLGIVNIFWASEKDQVRMIEQAHLDYIAVKKSRVYDDQNRKISHHGGYPQSFVEQLPALPFVTLIFENKEMSIWKINHFEAEKLISP